MLIEQYRRYNHVAVKILVAQISVCAATLACVVGTTKKENLYLNLIMPVCSYNKYITIYFTYWYKFLDKILLNNDS